MSALPSRGKAFNVSRQVYLATELAVANTFWTRLRGLLGLTSDDFRNGSGLWIVPCRGVHTQGMQFAIDVIYLDSGLKVVEIRSQLKPWRFSPIRPQATSVLELPCQTVAQTKTEIGDTIDITLSKD
jgi:uncharacterized protein